MKAGKIIKIFQMVGYYGGWEDYLKSSKRLVILKARKGIKIFPKVGYYEGWEDKIFQKVGYYEGWKDYQNLPKGWLL